ncbi:Uncharacterized protein FKW44_012715 [Caligus rogercresseyi]|uniref:Uncharacterized protein n=1 Tax=Caligus rogercresseyi TaxID=217165 RepID=A0A7T8HJS0_CALRO|nr:Uncharacterized protein FKW44_012715 [Caligus rogercresseyi]
MIRAHHDASDIVRILGIDRHTVYRVRKCLKDGESLKDRPRSGRPVKLNPELPAPRSRTTPRWP